MLMIADILLPEISENVESGDVVKILVSPGDRIEVDQPLIELETEKAVFEVPSTVAGTVSEILVRVGDAVKVSEVLARIDTNSESAGASASAEQKKSSAATAEAKPNRESSKPAVDQVSAAVEKVVATASSSKPAVAPSTDPAPASPTVRRLARELGLDINAVPGTAAGGRISAEDVRAFAKSIIQGAASAGGAGGPAPITLPDFSKFGEIERAPMSKIRQVTARNLARTWNIVPAVTQNDEADITNLETARRKYGPRVSEAGGKLTMTAILLKVCASALERFPEFNASVDIANQEIIYKKYYNIGVAVDTENGLLVPVMRDVIDKNIVDLSVELSQMAARARDRKLTPAEMEGANFTISNLGGIGGTGFSPIVNTPEVAILGVSRGKMTPTYIDGKFEPRLIMPLSLSYDHRAIDGAAAARFLRWICEALEHPILLALDN